VFVLEMGVFTLEKRVSFFLEKRLEEGVLHQQIEKEGRVCVREGRVQSINQRSSQKQTRC